MPEPPIPCTARPAISMPMLVALCIDFPSRQQSLLSKNVSGTHSPATYTASDHEGGHRDDQGPPATKHVGELAKHGLKSGHGQEVGVGYPDVVVASVQIGNDGWEDG